MRAPLTIAFCLGLSFFAQGQQEFQKKFQRLFIETPNDSIIRLPEGKFFLQGSLWLDGKKNVVIRGAGENKTILDFSAQVSGVAATEGAARTADWKEGIAVFTLAKGGLMGEASIGGQGFDYVPKTAVNPN